MLQFVLLMLLISVVSSVNAEEIKINSVKELAEYASQSGNVIMMSPGVYQLTDFLSFDSMIKRHERKSFSLSLSVEIIMYLI